MFVRLSRRLVWTLTPPHPPLAPSCSRRTSSHPFIFDCNWAKAVRRDSISLIWSGSTIYNTSPVVLSRQGWVGRNAFAYYITRESYRVKSIRDAAFRQRRRTCTILDFIFFLLNDIVVPIWLLSGWRLFFFSFSFFFFFRIALLFALRDPSVCSYNAVVVRLNLQKNSLTGSDPAFRTRPICTRKKKEERGDWRRDCRTK